MNPNYRQDEHEFWDLYMDSLLHDSGHYHRPAAEPKPERSPFATDDMIVIHENHPGNGVAVL